MFYEVTLKGVDATKYADMVEWLCDNYEEGQWQIGTNTRKNFVNALPTMKERAKFLSWQRNVCVIFSRQRHATHFKLRWGGDGR
jgi:hypothetical protein